MKMSNQPLHVFLKGMIICPLLWLKRDSYFKLHVLIEQPCFEVSDHCKYQTYL